MRKKDEPTDPGNPANPQTPTNPAVPVASTGDSTPIEPLFAAILIGTILMAAATLKFKEEK